SRKMTAPGYWRADDVALILILGPPGLMGFGGGRHNATNLPPRRDGVRCPRARARSMSARAAPGLRPGPLRDPARSWLGVPDFDLVGDEARPAAVRHRTCSRALSLRYLSACW